MIRALKILLPLLVLAGAVLGAMAIIKARPKVMKQPPKVLPPLVRVVPVEKRDVRLVVESQGTVIPRTESQLVPEVSGRVVELSPCFQDGGFFEKDEVLLRIDPRDYHAAVARARAEVAQRKLALAREEAEAAVARKEWETLGKDEPGDPLALHIPQLEEARALLAAAEAALAQAKDDLARTELKAPYAGRVRKKNVDVGQFVARGTPVGTIYAVDYAEVRLPIEDRELAFLDLPLRFRGDAPGMEDGPPVILRAEFAGGRHTWEGRIVRTEGEIDLQSRMVRLVARVRDPYGRLPGAPPDRPPLAIGLFVKAEIQGRLEKGLCVLPRAALHGEDTVWVVDPDEGRLRFRKVQVLRTTRRFAYMREGLAAGEQVCVSSLEAVTDGMRVRVAEKEGEKSLASAGEKSP